MLSESKKICVFLAFCDVREQNYLIFSLFVMLVDIDAQYLDQVIQWGENSDILILSFLLHLVARILLYSETYSRLPKAYRYGKGREVFVSFSLFIHFQNNEFGS